MVGTHTFDPYVYKYSFELLVEAYLRRFPTCELAPYILETVIISEEKNEELQTHTIVHDIKLDTNAPAWIEKLVGDCTLIFHEIITIDYKNRVMKTESKNKSMANYGEVFEETEIVVHPENTNWSILNQTGSANFKILFAGYIETFILSKFKERFYLARELDIKIIEFIIEERKTKNEIPVEKTVQ